MTAESGPHDQRAQFPLGQVVITRGALARIPAEDVHVALARHVNADWGDLCAEDWHENERALRDGCRLLSAYQSSSGDRFWIITEWDRSVTTILLPEDY